MFIFWFVLIVAVCPSSVYPKGSPNKIVITGGGLRRPIEINEREILKSFDPWMGQFIDRAKGPVAEPSRQDPAYDVFFYMKWSGRHSTYDRGKLKMVYTMRYVRGHDGQPGYIYLPGRGEEFYNNNIGTIWREKEDGRWHQASAAWEVAMRRVIVISNEPQRSPVNTMLWSIAFSVMQVCRLLGE